MTNKVQKFSTCLMLVGVLVGANVFALYFHVCLYLLCICIVFSCLSVFVMYLHRIFMLVCICYVFASYFYACLYLLCICIVFSQSSQQKLDGLSKWVQMDLLCSCIAFFMFVCICYDINVFALYHPKKGVSGCKWISANAKM